MPASFITRTRLLPYHGVVKVSEGDFVQATDVIAELDYVPGVLSKIDAAAQMKIEPTALPEHMLCQVGDKVSAGQPLAASFLFGEEKQALSKIAGYIGLISKNMGSIYVRQPVPVGSTEPVTIDVAQELGVPKLSARSAIRVSLGANVTLGQAIALTHGIKAKMVLSPLYGKVVSIKDAAITIQATYVSTSLAAYLTGRVQKVIPGQGATIMAWAHVLSGAYGVGPETVGEVLLAAEADEELTVSKVTPDWKDKIVVAGQTASLEVIHAATEAGCAGLIVGHLSFEDIEAYAEHKTMPGITGEEDVLMPLMLTERFNPAPMRSSIWHDFSALQGRFASMSGRTHIRAGLIRPEVIVCESEWPEGGTSAVENSPQLAEGDLVRVLRSPYTDQVGRVISILAERQKIATGSSVRVAYVKIGSEQVMLPMSNLVLVRGGDSDDKG